MSRSVVFKTPGKLDLRSLTVFGLNSKPNTSSPIGYFGTGLKYAVAVLAREHIPVTFWIDGKKWTVEQDATKFRDKEFRALFLKRHTLIPKTINLPFTTELGKNWVLWQAFRELESNTRDELGMTFVANSDAKGIWIMNGVDPEYQYQDGLTIISVESDKFVEEYNERDKTFLPDGLTNNNGTERIQVFPVRSKAVYYRSIRILDLQEPSENTYNILAQQTLTEDRTAKSEFDIKWEIQNYIAGHAPKNIIERVVTAPAKTFERNFDYEWASKSNTFLDTIQELGPKVNHNAKIALQKSRPPAPKVFVDWLEALIYNVNNQYWSRIEETMVNDSDREELLQILIEAKRVRDKEKANNGLDRSTDGSSDYANGRTLEERSRTTLSPTGNTLLDMPRGNDDDIAF